MTEIYSANPIEAFQGQLIAVALLLGIGLFSIPVLFRRGASALSRIAIGVLALFLIVAGLAVLAITFYQYTAGAQTFTAPLAKKQVVQTTAPDGTGTNMAFHLSFSPATELDVPQSAFEKLTEKTCYQVTYYPNKGMLGMFGVGGDSPVKSGAVSSIKQPPANQCR